MKDTRVADRNHYVVKSNELIQRSRYSLSLEEQRLVLFAIAKIKPTDDVSTWYEFSITDVCHACGLLDESGYYYTTLKNYLKALRDNSWFIKMPDGSETTVSWFDKVSINKGSGLVKVRFDSDLQQYLFELKTRYTQYKLEIALSFKCKYSIRLYELLLSYNIMSSVKNGIEKDLDFEVEDLKRKLNAETYKLYGDFKRKVLQKAIEEINLYSEDMNVELEEIHQGRKVVKVNFIITYPRIRQVIEAKQTKREQLNRY